MTATPKIEGLYVLQIQDLQITDTTWPQQVEAASATPRAPTTDLPQFIETLKADRSLGPQVSHLPGTLSLTYPQTKYDAD
jgi:hypothetical protein